MAPSINLADLGRRIRAARLARRMTLEETVSRTEFTVSWLSKIENGLLAPSLEGLVRLAEVLECPAEHLVAGLTVAPRFVVDRKGAGWTPAARDGSMVEQLATAWRERAMEPAILHLAGHGGHRSSPEHFDGERFLHVLAGEAKLTYGAELITLAAGDSVYLDGSLPHSLAPAGRGTARVMSIRFQPDRNGGGRDVRPRPAARTRRPRRGGSDAVTR